MRQLLIAFLLIFGLNVHAFANDEAYSGPRFQDKGLSCTLS